MRAKKPMVSGEDEDDYGCAVGGRIMLGLHLHILHSECIAAKNKKV